MGVFGTCDMRSSESVTDCDVGELMIYKLRSAGVRICAYTCGRSGEYQHATCFIYTCASVLYLSIQTYVCTSCSSNLAILYISVLV